MDEVQAIYTIWLREMIRTIRSKTRILASFSMPIFFLVIFGTGLNRSFSLPGARISYIDFIAPGIVAMSTLFTALFFGVSVIMDKQFGFMKEILVAPVSRLTILIGKILGGATLAICAGFVVLLIAIILGVKVSATGLLLSLLIMLIIALSFVSMGLAFASQMSDLQAYPLVANFIVIPMFFLSGALFPIDRLPEWLKILVYIDPLTYGVDALRQSMIGVSVLPFWLDITVMGVFCTFTILAGTFFFGRMR